MYFAAVALVGACLGQPPAPTASPASPAGTEYVFSKDRQIRLPVHYDQKTRSTIRQVILFVSHNGENTWYQEGTIPPDRDMFVYNAKEDGIFCFTIVNEDMQGKRDITDITKTPPDMKVIVDTVKPRIQFTQANRNADTIVIEWVVDDKYPNENLTKVSFKAASAPDNAWQAVSLHPTSKSGVKFSAGTTEPIIVRVTAFDMAMNKCEATYTFGLGAANPAISTSVPTNVASTVPPPPSAPPAPNPTPAPQTVAPPTAVAQTSFPTQSPIPAPDALSPVFPTAPPSVPTLPPSMPNPPAATAPSATSVVPNVPAAVNPVATVPPVTASPTYPPAPTAPVTAVPTAPVFTTPTPPTAMLPTVSTSNAVPQAPVGQANSTAQPLPVIDPKQAVVPAVQLNNSNSSVPTPVAVWTGPPSSAPSVEVSRSNVISYLTFDMGYELESHGPSGISRVDLWVTRDDGKTWMKWSQHDGKGGNVRVNLNAPTNPQPEGAYGFRIVPVSGAGLSEREPVAGDAPELRVVVDITPPKLDLFPPVSDPNNPDTLIIQWKASDNNFGEDPISLEWSDKPTGPWQPVATGGDVVQAVAGTAPVLRRLPNTGQFAWRVPAVLLPRVYLKVSARDAAGNVREVITRDPILVDLVKPRAKISGIVAPQVPSPPKQ